MNEVYVAECQSQYDGGGSIGVFSSLLLAKQHCEKQPFFNGWTIPEMYLAESNPDDKHNFYYIVNLEKIDNPE